MIDQMINKIFIIHKRRVYFWCSFACSI